MLIVSCNLTSNCRHTTENCWSTCHNLHLLLQGLHILFTRRLRMGRPSERSAEKTGDLDLRNTGKLLLVTGKEIKFSEIVRKAEKGFLHYLFVTQPFGFRTNRERRGEKRILELVEKNTCVELLILYSFLCCNLYIPCFSHIISTTLSLFAVFL